MGSTFHETALRAVNEAIVTLGQDLVLKELSEESKDVNSRKAAYVYESARLKVLRDHNWNFARREQICCGCTGPDYGGEFGYRMPLPGGCVRLLMCYGEDGSEVKYMLFGREIRSAAPIARIVYTHNMVDLTKWSPDAYRALVLRLAADLAKPITGRINERQLQEQAYGEQLAAAKLADARESNVMEDAWGGNHYVDAMRGRSLPFRPDFGRGL